MKSTNLANYQSDFFISTVGTYLTLKDKITKTVLVEYPYHISGNEYVGLRVEFMFPLDTELTDDEVNSVRFFDDCLEIFLGRNGYDRKDKSHAQSEISNLIKLFDAFCKNVEINPVNDRDEKTIDLKNLLMIRSFKKLPNYFNE